MTSPLRALLVTPDYPPALGGIQRLLQRVVSHARRLQTTVVTLDCSGAAEFDAEHPEDVHRVHTLSRDPRVRSVGLNLASLAIGLRARPDVVLSGHLVASPAAIALARAHRVPLLQYLYAKEIGHRPWMTRVATRAADATIGVSRHTLRLATTVGADPQRMHWIPPGVDEPTPSAEPKATAPLIVTVARLDDRHKGHDMVIRALPEILASVPDAGYVVIGQGGLRDELERLASDLGVAARVRFTGAVADGERDAWLARARVFVLPSRLPPDGMGGDGFPLVYLEASARGLPSVAGNVGGPPDAVLHDATGLLVDPEDPAQIADAVVSLLRDPQRAARLGEAAARRSLEFRWPRIAARLEELLFELCEAQVTGRPGAGGPVASRRRGDRRS